MDQRYRSNRHGFADDDKPYTGPVRVRACYGGQLESILGTLKGFENSQSGYGFTQGFELWDWHYEDGPRAGAQGHHLFIFWQSVFVIEEIDKLNPVAGLLPRKAKS